MRYFIRLCTAAALALVASSSSLIAQLSPAAQHLRELAHANSLDAEGSQPWHLRMSFHLNDVNGKPKESGTIEEWRASPQSHRLEIRSDSYNLTIPSESSGPPSLTARNRESFLVSELLHQVVHPIPDYGDFKDLVVTEADRTLGNASLSCISVSRPPRIPTLFCFAPGTTVLRGSLSDGLLAAVRNKIAKFRGIELGLDNSLAYLSKTAITGHIDTLESFQPTSSVVLTSTNDAPPAAIPGVVLAGRILKKVQPTYPEIAKLKHLSGTVVLCATITKQGTISNLDVVSSPDPSLSASALDAVKRWTYQPYMLNGQPVEVDTTVTVNFNLNSF